MQITKNLILFTLATLLFGCSISRGRYASEERFSFSEEQERLIMQADTAAPMRVFKITNRSDSILLRTESTNVDSKKGDPMLKHFVQRLYATVRDSMSLGVGIAAPQVGILKNIIWVQRFDKDGFPFEVYLNPLIKKYTDKKQKCREGCLSIPGRSDTTETRAYAILLEYDKLDGSHHTEMVEDFTAVIFQHEIDHLHGILYLDHLTKELRESN